MLPDEQIEIDNIVYKRYGEIGQGTCGHVYIVKSPEMKRYALKIINDYGRNPILKDMIDRQIATQTKFKSCNFIIRIYAHMQRFKKMYILFQLGTCSLRNLITMNTHVQLKEFLEICLDTTKGLYAIHSKQLIHRDIKPENIICVDKTYKITDFGSLQGGTAGDQFIGTTLYMPPELLNGQKYNQKLDVWSLGVSLFQTYFRIHPFYYLQHEGVDADKAKQHLQNNIKCLLPKFTLQKFIALIKGEVGVEKAEQIKNIAAVTPTQLIQQFTNFFQYQEERPDIEFFVCAFESLRDCVWDRICKKTKLQKQIEQLPSDIRFYVDTLNLFYELSSSYGTNKFEEVEFHIELGIWYWNFYNYMGQKFIKYSNYPSLKAYRKEKKILWEQVKSALFDYWLELSTNRDLQFFPHLPILKVRILLCAARFDIISSQKETDNFLQRTSGRITMQVKTLYQLQNQLPIFQICQLRAIEEILTNHYFYK